MSNSGPSGPEFFFLEKINRMPYLFGFGAAFSFGYIIRQKNF